MSCELPISVVEIGVGGGIIHMFWNADFIQASRAESGLMGPLQNGSRKELQKQHYNYGWSKALQLITIQS
jgi:hypothetical protein